MSEPAGGYEFFEHTADVGIRARGLTLPEAFDAAARGLVALLIDESAVAARETRDVALTADSVEALLREWLSMVLFWFMTERFLADGAELDVTPTSLRGHVSGERFDPSKHAAGTEVKGVTRHQLTVRQTAGGWEASVIVDV